LKATASQSAEKLASGAVLKGHGFTGCGKTLFTRCFERARLHRLLSSRDVLKGHGFSRAEQVLSLCHSERALAREESAFPTFSATSSVVPQAALQYQWL